MVSMNMNRAIEAMPSRLLESFGNYALAQMVDPTLANLVSALVWRTYDRFEIRNFIGDVYGCDSVQVGIAMTMYDFLYWLRQQSGVGWTMVDCDENTVDESFWGEEGD